MLVRYPWPLSPLTQAWHLTAEIPVTQTDRAAIDWLLTQSPHGPIPIQDTMRLIITWIDDAFFYHHVPNSFGWWFFLSWFNHHQLWHKLRQAQQAGRRVLIVHGDFFIPVLPLDKTLMTHPLTLTDWINQFQCTHLPSDPTFRQQIIREVVLIGWRLAFWQQWRERRAHIQGTVTPHYGIKTPVRDKTPSSLWVQTNLLDVLISPPSLSR